MMAHIASAIGRVLGAHEGDLELMPGDVLVWLSDDQNWTVICDRRVLSVHGTRETAVEAGRSRIQRDRTSLWLVTGESVRKIASYRCDRRDGDALGRRGSDDEAPDRGGSE